MDHGKHVIDAASIANVMATLAGWLPSAAAFFTILWTLIRIYETHTVQIIIKKLKGEG